VEDGAHLSLAGQDPDTHAYFWTCPRCQRKLITGEYIEESKARQSATGSADEKGTDETSEEEVSQVEEPSQEEVSQVDVAKRKRHKRG